VKILFCESEWVEDSVRNQWTESPGIRTQSWKALKDIKSGSFFVNWRFFRGRKRRYRPLKPLFPEH
jgi:hypothetical protein